MHRSGVIVIALVMIAGALLTGCSDKPPEFSYNDLPPGDAARGAEAFQGDAECSGCHRLDDIKSVGPALNGFGETAGSRVKGQSAEDYTFNSILRPSKYTVQGFSNVMPGDYEKKLSQQTIADLITYLLTL